MAPTGSTPPRGQHTPGPWLIEYAETGMRWPVIYVEDEAWDGGRREIAQISGHIAKRGKDDRWRKTPDAEESEATARLIALAPELYDLVAYVATHRCQHPESPGDCHYCAARALIRRAGESAAKLASVEEA